MKIIMKVRRQVPEKRYMQSNMCWSKGFVCSRSIVDTSYGSVSWSLYWTNSCTRRNHYACEYSCSGALGEEGSESWGAYIFREALFGVNVG